MSFYNALNKEALEVFESNKKQGFWEDYKNMMNDADTASCEKTVKSLFVAQRLALITSEISEALEADRKDLMDDKLTHRKGLEVELADALIRILDMAGGMELDLGGAVEEKLAYNKTRAYKHGKAY